MQLEMIHDRLLDPAHISRFKTLILPNIAVLSDAQCDQLRAFVAAGGSLIATHQTSLYDPSGALRQNFALADLFGVDWTGKSEGPMQNSYIRLEHEALPHSPFFAGLEDAPRVINGVSRLLVTPRAPFAETPFTLIPSYPDLPMEEVYPRVPRTDISCLYLRQPAGRVAYFPFDIDRTFWEVLSPDHLKIMRNTLHWAANEPAAIEVEGPGLVDVNLWRNPSSITVSLVNLTNAMTMKGPFRGFSPIGAQTVRLRLPELAQARNAKSARRRRHRPHRPLRLNRQHRRPLHPRSRSPGHRHLMASLREPLRFLGAVAPSAMAPPSPEIPAPRVQAKKTRPQKTWHRATLPSRIASP